MTPDAASIAPPRHLFVYGTLRPGEVRWPFLEPFVVDDGVNDSVTGHLFDTGLGYPAAALTTTTDDSSVVGRTFELRNDVLGEALEKLDEVEGAVRGLYIRIQVETAAGFRAWAYEYGTDPLDPDIGLTRISGGDWLTRSG